MVRAPTITRVLLLIALLGAVGLRLLCAPGWMPNIDGRPGSLMVICTGEGVRPLEGARHPAPSPAHDRRQHDQCAFSGVAFAPGPAVLDLARAAEAPEMAPVLVSVGREHSGPDRRRAQAPRAPPLAL